MTHRCAVLAVAALLLPAPAAAETGFLSGNSLLEKCSSQNRQAHAECLGYVQGVADLIADAQSSRNMLPVICKPPGLNAGQLRNVVMKALRAKPESRADLGADLVYDAMAAAWPCKATR